MRIGPFTITRRQKSAVSVTQWPTSGPGWWPVIREGFSGAWQRSVTATHQDVLTQSTVWACMTLIAADISKLEFQLLQRDADGLTTPIRVAAFSQVLDDPNHFQNRINFIESWVLSKLQRGNTYVLKVRDNRNVVTDLYVLEPTRVQPMVTPNGDVYYQIGQDVLSGVTSASIMVPASEIIHDRWNCQFHPLVGLSPLTASALAATQGLKIQHASVSLFANGASMSGILTAPGQISAETAKRLEDVWNSQFAGDENRGKIAVAGDGLKFEKMTMTSVDAQMIDQLKWSDEKVCSTFHVPAYMVGVGQMPNYNNIEALNQQYYSQCLHGLVEAIELCLEKGLGTLTASNGPYEIEADLRGLLRMDSTQQMAVAKDGVAAGIFTPNEGRARWNLKPLKGGDTVYMQQQDIPLEVAAAGPAPPIPPPPALKPGDPPMPPTKARAALTKAITERMARAA